MTPSDLPADLGLHLPTEWADTVAVLSTALWRADVQQRRVLMNTVFASSAVPASALRWLTSPPAPAPAGTGRRKVGDADIQAIRELTRSYREMDNRLGGGKLRAVVVAYLDDQVACLLTNGAYQEETGRRLAAACGELSQLAKGAAYDSDEHGIAQRYLTQALAYARHADDPALAAEILAAQAYQALYLSRPAAAIDLARAAQAAATRSGSATLLTECLVTEAHGHAARDDARTCGTTLALAERTFDRATREDNPAWLEYFDEAYLAARMAQCFRDLGEAAHAAQYAQLVAEHGRPLRGAAGAFNLSLLAAARAAQREPEQACQGRAASSGPHCPARLRPQRPIRSAHVVRRLRPYGGLASRPGLHDRGTRTPACRSSTCCTPMIVIAPRMSPRADHRLQLIKRHPGVTSAASSVSRLANLLRAPRAEPNRSRPSAFPMTGWHATAHAPGPSRAPACFLFHLPRRRRAAGSSPSST